MTLIISLSCKDGIVMASDSQATERITGNVLQDVSFSMDKLFCFPQGFLWGGSGDVSIIQRVKLMLSSSESKNWKARSISDARDFFRRTVTDVLKDILQHGVKDLLPPSKLSCAFIFTGYINSQPIILEVTEAGLDTDYQERGFHAIGSGGVFAQMCHAMLYHYKIRTLSVEQGLYVAYRVMETAIQAAAGGIGGDIQLAKLLPGSPPQILDKDNEKKGIRDAVGGWKQTEVDSLPGILRPGFDSGKNVQS